MGCYLLLWLLGIPIPHSALDLAVRRSSLIRRMLSALAADMVGAVCFQPAVLA